MMNMSSLLMANGKKHRCVNTSDKHVHQYCKACIFLGGGVLLLGPLDRVLITKWS